MKALGPTQRRRRSRGTHGSATLELIVVMPLFVTLMAISFWATELYEAKITAMKAVRGPVFTEATFGCGAPGDTSFTPPDALEAPGHLARLDDAQPIGRVEGADLGVVARKLPSAPGADVIDRAAATRGARAVSPVVANGLVGISTRVTGRTSMTCNESVHDGDPRAIKRVAGDAFDPRSP